MERNGHMPIAKRRKLCNNLSLDEVATSLPGEEDLTLMLPVDCLYHIFKWLGTNDKLRIEKVCKRWQNIITAKGWPEDGKHLDFSLFKKHAWRKISQKRGRHTSILVADFSRSELLVSRIIKKYFHRLEYLTITLSQRYFPVKCAQQFFTNMDKIFDNNRKLKVLTMLVDDMRLIEDFIHHVPSNISGLSLQYVSSTTTNQYLSIDLSKFNNLESLEILKCRLNENSLKGLEELQHLKSLIIKCDGAELSQNPLSISPKCVKLEKLVLRCNVTNHQLALFLSNCPNLKVFIALYNGGDCLLTLETMKCLSRYCPKLQELYFYGHFLFAEESMPHFPNLKTLVFTDPECGPQHKNRIVQFIEHSPKLGTLFASYCAFHPFLKQIHDVLLKRSTRIPLELVLPSLSKKWREIKFSSLITIHAPDYVNQMRLMRFIMQEK